MVCFVCACRLGNRVPSLRSHRHVNTNLGHGVSASSGVQDVAKEETHSVGADSAPGSVINLRQVLPRVSVCSYKSRSQKKLVSKSGLRNFLLLTGQTDERVRMHSIQILHFTHMLTDALPNIITSTSKVKS